MGVNMAKIKKKLNGLDIYVIFSIASMVLYTIISQIIQVATGYTNDILTTRFFEFFGGEIVTCALIKIFKLTKEAKVVNALKQEYNWDHPDNDTTNEGEEEEVG